YHFLSLNEKKVQKQIVISNHDLDYNNHNIHSFYFYFGRLQKFYLQIYLDQNPIFPQDYIRHDYLYSVIPSIYTNYAKDILFTKHRTENRWKLKIPQLHYSGVGMYLLNHRHSSSANLFVFFF